MCRQRALTLSELHRGLLHSCASRVQHLPMSQNTPGTGHPPRIFQMPQNRVATYAILDAMALSASAVGSSRAFLVRECLLPAAMP